MCLRIIDTYTKKEYYIRVDSPAFMTTETVTAEKVESDGRQCSQLPMEAIIKRVRPELVAHCPTIEIPRHEETHCPQLCTECILEGSTVLCDDGERRQMASIINGTPLSKGQPFAWLGNRNEKGSNTFAPSF